MVKQAEFGLMFAINGVLLSGGDRAFPYAKAAFAKLIDGRGNFRVPTVFMTNMTGFGQQAVAHKLMLTFGAKIDPEQIVMGHSPLRLFRQFHNQHIFVCGSGNTREIMHQLGFNKVSNADQLRETYRSIYKGDSAIADDHGTVAYTQYGPLQSIVLLNEPEQWEANLQLILDLLFSNGFRSKRIVLRSPGKPHLPIIACGVDLLKAGSFIGTQEDRQSNAELDSGPPRIGHGAFLIALEQLYEKLSGQSLQYTALVGKPSPIMYVYAERVLRELARRSHCKLRRIYAICDNPHGDVYGANLFNRLLTLRRSDQTSKSQDGSAEERAREDEQLLANVNAHAGMSLASILDQNETAVTQKDGDGTSLLESNTSKSATPSFVTASSSVHRARLSSESDTLRLQFSGVATSRHVAATGVVAASVPAPAPAPPLVSSVPSAERSAAVESCVSVLVQTGVTSEMGAATVRFAALDHFHRDLPRFRDCSTPAHVCPNVHDAVATVFAAEKYEPNSAP